jgi:hypothetical protein
MTKNRKSPATKKRGQAKSNQALPITNDKADFTPTITDETVEGEITVRVDGVEPPAKPPADFEPLQSVMVYEPPDTTVPVARLTLLANHFGVPVPGFRWWKQKTFLNGQLRWPAGPVISLSRYYRGVYEDVLIHEFAHYLTDLRAPGSPGHGKEFFNYLLASIEALRGDASDYVWSGECEPIIRLWNKKSGSHITGLVP